jgi:hypothetical protein
MKKWDQMASGWGDRMYQAELKRRREQEEEMRLEEEREERRQREQREYQEEMYRKRVIAENERLARENSNKNDTRFGFVKRLEKLYSECEATQVKSVQSINSYEASVWFLRSADQK